MSLTRREKTFVAAAGVFVVLFVGWMTVGRPLVRAWRGAGIESATLARSFEDAEARVARARREGRALAELAGRLGVTIPDATPALQKQTFLASLEDLARQNGLKISSLVETNAPGRRAGGPLSAGTAVAWRLVAETSQEGLVKYLAALEALPRPVLFDSVEARTAPNDAKKVTATLVVATYILEARPS